MDNGRPMGMELRRPTLLRLPATRLILMPIGARTFTPPPARLLMCQAPSTPTAVGDKPASLDSDPVSASQRRKQGRAVIQAHASNHRPRQGDLYLISPAERAKVSAIAL